MPAFSGTADIELALLAQLGFPPPSKHTDGTRPHYFWISPGGADGVGNGSYKEPYLTWNRAIRETVDGRGDYLIGSPAIYRQNLDIGSGSTARGATDGYAKRDLKLIGAGGVHPGRIQIVGDGTSTGPTIRVRNGYLRGLLIADLEVGSVDSADADRAQFGIDLTTSDTATTLTATSSSEWAVLKNVRLDGGATGLVGLYLTGTTMLKCYNLELSGWTHGIAFRGSLNNFPDHCHFWDTQFQDNVTADIATIIGPGEGGYTTPILGPVNLSNVTWMRNVYKDRGGTPVTNYVNAAGIMVNVGDYEFVAARDVADATLMQLPVDWVAIGRSAAAAEFIIGA